MVKKQKADIRQEWVILIATKIIYVAYILVIPMMVLSVAWWQWLIGFVAMHYVAGFILAIIFQPAHVIDGTEFPMPDANGKMDNSWAIHQLHTTTNFANNSTFFSWYVGGLNFQVEHHLFPKLSATFTTRKFQHSTGDYTKSLVCLISRSVDLSTPLLAMANFQGSWQEANADSESLGIPFSFD